MDQWLREKLEFYLPRSIIAILVLVAFFAGTAVDLWELFDRLRIFLGKPHAIPITVTIIGISVIIVLLRGKLRARPILVRIIWAAALFCVVGGAAWEARFWKAEWDRQRICGRAKRSGTKIVISKLNGAIGDIAFAQNLREKLDRQLGQINAFAELSDLAITVRDPQEAFELGKQEKAPVVIWGWEHPVYGTTIKITVVDPSEDYPWFQHANNVVDFSYEITKPISTSSDIFEKWAQTIGYLTQAALHVTYDNKYNMNQKLEKCNQILRNYQKALEVCPEEGRQGLEKDIYLAKGQVCEVKKAYRRGAPVPQVELDFPELPPNWTVEKAEEISIDGDDEIEWLVIYRYDKFPGGFGGPLGGIILDRQPPSPQDITVCEYSLKPYPLLPSDRWMGHLGESVGGEDKPWPEIKTYDVNGNGKSELVILGYSAYAFPTNLAIFRWVDKEKEYQPMIHTGPGGLDVLWGDDGIEIEPAFGHGPIRRVIVRHRIDHPYWYFRSRLSRRIVYEWNTDHTKLEKKSECIDFAFGRPWGASKPGQSVYPVTYPEAAVLAYYEQGQVQEIVALQEDKNEAQVTVKVIIDGQLVEQICKLTRNSTRKGHTYWECSCPE